MTKVQICKLFNCTIEQLNTQFKGNAEVLNTMRMKAKKTGKKVNAFTESQLTDYTNKYNKLSS